MQQLSHLKGSSVTGKNVCNSGFMSHGSCAPVTFCRPSQELVGSQMIPDESQMQWSSGRYGCRSLSHTHSREGPRTSDRSKRPSRVSPCQRCVLRCPTPKVMTMSKSLEELARVVARVQGSDSMTKRRTAKPATKTGLCLCRFPHGCFLDDDTTSCACMVDHLKCRDARARKKSLSGAKSCEDTRSTTELSNRSWDVPQICEGARAPSGRRTSNSTVPKLRIRTNALSSEFSITMDLCFLLP